MPIDCEAGYDRGYKVGYRVGYEVGYDQGYEEGVEAERARIAAEIAKIAKEEKRDAGATLGRSDTE